MTAAVTRDITVVYAGLTLGGTSDYVLDGPFTYEEAYDKLLFRCQVLLNSDTSEAAFLTAEALLLAAFRTPRGTLTVNLGSTNRATTGFDATPSIQKIGSPFDTGQSARYVVEVVARCPADLSGQSGRFDSKTQLVTPANSRRLMTLSGEYTALGSNTGYEQYLAAVNTFSSSRLSLFSMTNVELLTDELTISDSVKVCTFTRIYQELLAYQTVSLLDDPGLKDTRLVISKSETDAGSSDLAAQAPTELMAEYEATLDSAVSTDLKGYWETKVRPKLLAEVRRLAGAAFIIITGVAPKLDLDNNHLFATVTAQVYKSSLVELSIETEDRIQFGVILLPVWDGNPFSKDRQPGLGDWFRTITIIKYTTEANPGLAGYNNPIDTPDMDEFVEVERVRRRVRTYLGVRNAQGGIQQLLRETTIRTYVRASKPEGITPSPPPKVPDIVPSSTVGRIVTSGGTSTEQHPIISNQTRIGAGNVGGGIGSFAGAFVTQPGPQ